eukprot:m.91429 g.91429  ORF g.91429 m.91429 type:complete len:264 (-) comp15038_c0_seq1:27-818(-)
MAEAAVDRVEVKIVPCLTGTSDNYSYLIIDKDTRQAAAVDPVEPDKVLQAAQDADVKVIAVLTTHDHWDHAGGNEEMAKRIPGLRVYGGARDKIPAVTDPVQDGDVVSVGGLRVQCLDTACHTPGHICYYVADAVFTGDTMFVAGCGNFNSGTPKQMHHAMLEKLGSLPPDTRVFVGHEYTVKNLLYAISVEPDNEAISKKLAWAKKCRATGTPTVPSCMADEWATNPFMRVREPTVQAYTGKTDPVEAIFEVRKRKSAWKRT